MPISLAIVGLVLALTTRYWTFGTLVLYGVVGYLLGSVLQLRNSLRETRGELDIVLQKIAKLLQQKPEAQTEEREEVPVETKVTVHKEAPRETTRPAETPVYQEPARPIPRPMAPIPPPRVPRGRTVGDSVSDFFTKGNVFAKIGAILLFFGIAFLIKLVSEQGFFPLEFRLLAAGATALVLMALGWRLRKKNERYAVILQGTGFGVFYLTVFGAFRIWDLLPAPLAFGLVVGATILFSLLSVLQSSKALAALALLGGFSAPVLISTGSGNHVALFSYYALLNIGVALIAKYRPWRELNLIGFAFTYGVGAAWGLKYYTPEHFASVEPFLIFYFVLYVCIALFFSKLQLRFSKDFIVDATLVFGVPIATFALQARLVRDMEYGLALSAAAMGAFYVILATALYRKGREDIRLMVEAFLASGICFTILAVPFALNNAWTSAVWALQGAFLVWVSVRQNRPIGRYFGMSLQVLASFAFFTRAFPETALTPVANAWFLGSLIIFVSCFFVGHQFFKKGDKVSSFERNLVGFFAAAAIFWWIFGVSNEVPRLVQWWFGGGPQNSGMVSYPRLSRTILDLRLLVVGVSFLGFFLLARAISWPVLRYAGFGLLMVFFIALPASQFAAFQALDATAPLFGSHYVSALLLALSAFVISRSLFLGNGAVRSWEKSAHWVFLVAGYYWWILGHKAVLGTLAARIFADAEIRNMYSEQLSFMLIFIAASSVLFRVLAPRLKWMPLASLRLAMTSLATYYGVQCLAINYRDTLLHGPGLIAWPLTILVFYLLLRDSEKNLEKPFNGFQHFSGYWLFSILALREVFLFIDLGFDTSRTWPWVAEMGATGLLVLLPLFAPANLWPFGAHRKAYLKVGVAPLLVLLVGASQILNLVSSGNSAPLPFIPVLNPVDLLGLFIVLVLIFHYLALEKLGSFRKSTRTSFWIFIGMFAFAWLTMGLIRCIHQLSGVAWDFDSIVRSHLVQAALSIFWGTLALFGMVIAHRKAWRGLWVAGTVLMGTVVVKLFTLDLNESGTLERVVSFIGAGVLLLLVGYFAPIPPKSKEIQ